MKSILFIVCLVVLQAWSQTTVANAAGSLQAEVRGVYPTVQALYIDLHEHPELSAHEVNTAAKLAAACGRSATK